LQPVAAMHSPVDTSQREPPRRPEHSSSRVHGGGPASKPASGATMGLQAWLWQPLPTPQAVHTAPPLPHSVCSPPS
jgi:hypothetical protein